MAPERIEALEFGNRITFVTADGVRRPAVVLDRGNPWLYIAVQFEQEHPVLGTIKNTEVLHCHIEELSFPMYPAATIEEADG